MFFTILPWVLVAPFVAILVKCLVTKTKPHPLEIVVQIALALVVGAIAATGISVAMTTDSEAWNGVIVSKYQKKVSCSHSYRCRCRTKCSGYGKDKTCREVCDTCYEHFHDFNWILKTSNEETISISRVDRQGVKTPPRWEQAKLGEPTTLFHTYTNYVRNAEGSLFNFDGASVEKFKDTLPPYPDDVYDYHRLDRFLVVGDVRLAEPQKVWNDDLSHLNGVIGPQKQANIILVATSIQDPQWAYALRSYWKGAKKNDVILVMGVHGDTITWADVVAWSKDETLKVQLRDAILALGKLDRKSVLSLVHDNVTSYFDRKPMADFEYLKGTYRLSTGHVVGVFFLSLFMAIVATIVFAVLTEEERSGYRTYSKPYSSPRRRRTWR